MAWSDQMPFTNEYSLLIVESPVIAHRIQTLRIPWLEVIATEGFCWHPKFNASTGTLAKKADPDKKEIRKKIKEKAPWAVRTVIATDSDASGDFIAWTLAAFLRKNRIERCHLQLLTEAAITNSIENRIEIPADSLKNKLEKQFLLHHLWKRHFRVPAANLLMSALFLKDNLPFKAFRSPDGNLFFSDKPVLTSFSSKFKCDKPGNDYRLAKPPSLFDLLDALALEYSETGFERMSCQLFKLFTARLNGNLLNPISYPRTATNGYYKETWESIEKNRIMHREFEGLRPPPYRDILDDKMAHESLRPSCLQTDPKILKGKLKRNLYNIYAIICSQFADSISCPAGKSLKLDDLNNTSIWPVHKSRNDDITGAAPVWTAGTAGKVLSYLGVIRPSNYGKLLDTWIAEHKLHADGPVLSAQKFLETDPELANKAFLLMQACRKIIDDSTATGECFHEVFTEYL